MAFQRAVRRSTAFLLCIGAIVAGAPADAQEPSRNAVLVTLPVLEVRAFFATNPVALGLGVFPESRDPREFVREIGYGAPHDADSSSRDARPVRLADRLVRHGVRIQHGSFGGNPPGEAALREAFRSTVAPSRGTGSSVTVIPLDRAVELESVLDGPPLASLSPDIVLLGLGERTPVLIGLCPSPCNSRLGRTGILDRGIARRPGIVTPYDLGATIMSLTGVPRPKSGFIGNALTVATDRDPLARIESLEDRLVRDASVGSTAAVVTDAITVTVLLLGVLLVATRRTGIAARGAQGGWMAVAVGYPASLFIGGGSGSIRAIPVAVAFVLGAALRPQRSVLTARLFFVVAVATAALFAVAPLNAGGEPGLSIWGNPLTSWRFFGMQNAWAATVAGGVVVWGALGGLDWRPLMGVAIPVGVVMGAPSLGANFVGVLTFTFGTTLAVLALARRSVHLAHVAIAGAAAVGAFLLSLLADVGSPVAHGGRAAERISEGGISAAWDLVTGRLRLNIDLIRGFWGGVLWVFVFLGALVLLSLWGARAGQKPIPARAAVWAGAMMGLASMVLEDSGFYSGTTLLGASLAAYIMAAAALTRSPSAPPLAAGG